MAKIDTISYVDLLDVYEATFDAASVAASTVSEQDVTVSGVLAADYCMAVFPPAGGGLSVVNAWVKAADTITVQFSNPTASPVDLTSGTFTFIIARG